MKKRLIVGAFILLITFFFCVILTAVIVFIRSQKQLPTYSVNFDNYCSDEFNNKNVEIEGYFTLPEYFSFVSDKYSSGSFRSDIQKIYSKTFNIRTENGSGKNQMPALPKNFDESNFKPKDKDGNIVSLNDKVKIIGLLEKTSSCTVTISSIEIIEPVGDKQVVQLTESDIAEYKPISQADFCSKANTEKYVIVDAYVDIPFFTSSCGYSCTIQGGFEPKEDFKNSFHANISVGNGPNEMSVLPQNYTDKDLKIKDKNGNLINTSKLVSIKGTRSVTGDKGCIDTNIFVKSIENK